MKLRSKKMNQFFALLLTIAMLVGMLPTIALAASAAQTGLNNYVVELSSDPSTSTRPSTFGKASDDGRIWTDKSVAVNGTQFDVTLSALAQEYVRTSTSQVREQAAADVALVIDLSSSMDAARVTNMTNAVNKAIEKIMSANRQNRIGLYYFSTVANSGTLLPLASYYTTATGDGSDAANRYVSNSGTDFKRVANVTQKPLTGTETKTTATTVNVAGGTATQYGLYTAINAVTADIKGRTKKSTDAERIPYLLLFTDGEANRAYPNWYNDLTNTSTGSSGRGTELSGSGASGTADIAALTTLSAAKLKDQLSQAYQTYNGNTKDSIWFNIAFGPTEGNNLATALLKPTSVTSTSTGTLKTVLTSLDNYTTKSSTVPAADKKYGPNGNPGYQYAQDYIYFVDLNDLTNLNKAFTDLTGLVEAATQEKIIPFEQTSASGEPLNLVVNDVLGAGMELKTAPKMGAVTGVAKPSTGTVTSYGFADLETTVEYNSATREVKWIIPPKEVPLIAFSDRKSPTPGNYSNPNQLPVQLTYTVGLTAAYSSDTPLYSSEYEGAATPTTRFIPVEDNPYYYTGISTVDDKIVSTRKAIGSGSNDITPSVPKSSNTTGTATETYAYKWGVEGTDNVFVTDLGNNGKIAPKMKIEVSPTSSSVAAGDKATYLITVTNLTGDNISNVIVNNAAPSGLTFVTGSIKEDGAAKSSATFPYTVSSVPANGSVALTFEAAVPSNAASGTQYINDVATITSVGGSSLSTPATVASDKVTVAATFSPSVTVKLDGANYSGRTVTLWKDGASKYTLPASGGVYTTSGVTPGTYDIYVNGVSTGVQLSSSDSSKEINYYSVSFYDGAQKYDTPAVQTILSGGKAVVPTAPTKVGYTFDKWVTTNGGNTAFDFNTAITSATSVYAAWTANTNTAYKVNHYQAELDGSDPAVPTEVEDLTGTTGGTTSAQAQTYTGFTAKTFDQETIAADGSTVVSIHYSRNLYDISFEIDSNKGTTTDETTYEVLYGATPTEPEITNQLGYEFKGWNKTIAPVTGDETYTAQFEPTEFEITYVLDGGSVVVANPATYTIESSGITLNNPTKQGYDFSGWTGTGLSGSTTTVTIAQGSTGERTYEAHWTPSTDTAYKVNHHQAALDGTYSAAPTVENLSGTTGDTTSAEAQDFPGFTAEAFNQGTIAADGSTVIDIYYTRNEYTISFVIDPIKGTTADETTTELRYGATPTVPGIAAEPGYAFKDWNKSIAPVTSDETYTAQFDLIDFSIDYDLDGGNLVDANPAAYTVESAGITLNNPTKQGYAFGGWTGTGLNSSTTTVTIAQGSTGDRTYEAHWVPNADTSYKVNHHQAAVDGTYSTAPTVENLSGTTGEETSAEAQTFTGFTAESFNQATIAADGSTVIDIYYARNLYDISFVIDPSKATATDETTTKVRYEATPTAPKFNIVPGYEFTGWNKALEPAIGNETYTAQFDLIDFSITYSLDHGSVNPSNPAAYTVEGDGFTLTNPTKSGYTFTGWTGTDLSEPSFNVVVEKGSIGDRFYTATWTANTSTVILDDNGGSGGSESVTATYDEPMPTATAPSQAGYTFIGYFDQISDGTKYYNEDMTSAKIWDKTDASVTLYAVWTELGKVTIQYAANQAAYGTVNSAYESLNPETGTAVGSVATAKPGYRFVEWQDANGAAVSTSASFVPQKDSGSYAAATYTAVFEVVVYNITYNLEGGETAPSNPATYTVGDDDFTLTNPTKLGYTFAGWTGTGLSEPTLAVKVDNGSTGDREYTATWTVVPANGNYIVIGTVIDDHTPPANLAGADVEIVKGNTQYGDTATTDADGKFIIRDVPAGIYDLKITMGEKTAIIAVTIGGETQVVDLGKVIFPYNASSALKLKGTGTPPIVIDNLQPEAVDYLLNDYNNTGFAKVEMTIEKINEATNVPELVTAMGKIKTAAQNNNLTIGIYLDMILEKFYRLTENINWGYKGLIERTNGLIKVIIPIPADLQGKSSYTVYRYHGNAVNVISTTANVDGEYLTLDQSDWTLTLYVRNFSVYAIAYNTPQVTIPPVIVGTTNVEITFNGDGGTPSSTTQTAVLGELLTKPADPVKPGYTFAGWYKADGSEWNFSTDKASSDLTLTAKWTIVKTDIPALDKVNHFAYMQGYPDRTFGPQKNMTRAEVTVMFARLLVEKMDVDKTYASKFTDINPAKWYANAIGYMEQFGIITGYTDGTFRPDAQITRAEFAAIASRFDELITGEPNNFTDVTDDYWAKDYITSAAAKGWIKGYPDGTFKPGNYITRAEVVSLVNRMLERYSDKSYVDGNKDIINQYVDLASKHWAYYDIMEATNSHDYEKTSDSETWTSNTK